MQSKIATYLKAEYNHALNGAVSDVDAKKRLDACMTCEHRAVEYKGMVDPAGVGYCAGGCGCGASGRAQLQTKVTIAGAVCPKGKWENATQTVGGTTQSALNAIKGIFLTAKSFMVFNKKNKVKPQQIDMEKIQTRAYARMAEINKQFGFPPINPANIKITVGTNDSLEGKQKVG